MSLGLGLRLGLAMFSFEVKVKHYWFVYIFFLHLALKHCIGICKNVVIFLSNPRAEEPALKMIVL